MLSGVDKLDKLLAVLGGISSSSSSGLKVGSSPSSSDPSPSPDLSPYITGITVVPSNGYQLRGRTSTKKELTNFTILVSFFCFCNLEDFLQVRLFLEILGMLLVVEPIGHCLHSHLLQLLHVEFEFQNGGTLIFWRLYNHSEDMDKEADSF